MGLSEREERQAEGTMARFDDAHLAQLARTGDAGAFGELVRRHHRGVYRLAAAILGNRSEAEDAAQESFVRTYESLERYDSTRAFRPWLRGIVVKVCRQQQRRWARRYGQQAPLVEARGEPMADEAAEPSMMLPAVLAALAKLDDNYRLPLILFYLEQASVGEVAETLELSVGTARVRLHRGREKLRQMLADHEAGEVEE